MSALSTGVDLLDSNMQKFNGEMGNLSTQVGTLNTQAFAGIKQLLDGFAQCKQRHTYRWCGTVKSK